VQELEINVQDLPDEIIDRDLGELQTREAAHDLLEKKVTKEPPNTQIMVMNMQCLSLKNSGDVTLYSEHDTKKHA
jgi:hypothetical protein